MDRCLYKVLAIILVGLNFSVREVNSQRDNPSESDCNKYCHDDCSQYFHGSEFSPCVRANVHCSCGLLPIVRIVLIIIGVLALVIISICVIRICKRRSISTSTRFAGPISPNVGGGNFSQPVPMATPYPFASAPSVPVNQQLPYNPGFANYNSLGSSESFLNNITRNILCSTITGSPSSKHHKEIISSTELFGSSSTAPVDPNQSHKEGWSFESKQ